MGFPLYHLDIIVLNHRYWLIFIHIMHTGLLFGWDSSMALYELVFFIHLIMFLIVETRYVFYTIYDSFENK